MTRPVVSQFTEDWYDELPETYRWLDETRGGWALLSYMSLLGDLAGEVEAIADSVEDGTLTDPATAPARVLPWLAQFAGVRARPGQTAAALRAAIVGATGYQSGTRAQIAAVVRPLLGGTQSVSVLSHAGPAGPAQPWTIAVVVRDVELPAGGAAALAAAVEAANVTPAGYAVVVTPYTATWATIDALGSTWAPREGLTWAALDSVQP